MIQPDRVHSKVIPFKNDFESLVFEFLGQLDVSRSSAEAYRYKLNYFMDYLRSNSINTPQKCDIVHYKQQLISQNKSKNTIRSSIIIVRQFFKWMVDEGYYDKDISKGLKLPPAQKRNRRNPLNLNQIKSIVEIAKQDTSLIGKRNFGIFLTLICTSMRISSLSKLQLKHVQEESTGRWVLNIQGKGRVDYGDDVVYFSTDLAKLVKEYINMRKKLTPESFLFPSHSNSNREERISTRSLSSIIKSFMLKINLDSCLYVAHSLRHSGIFLGLQAGASITDIMGMSHHRSPQIISDHYVSDIQRNSDPVEQRISDSIFSFVA